MFQGQYGRDIREFYPSDIAQIKRKTRRHRRYTAKRELAALPPDELESESIELNADCTIPITTRVVIPAAKLSVGLHDRVRHRRAV